MTSKGLKEKWGAGNLRDKQSKVEQTGCWSGPPNFSCISLRWLVSIAADEGKVVAFAFFSHASRAVPCESSEQSLYWHTLNGKRTDKELKTHAGGAKPLQICQGDWLKTRSTLVHGASQW